MTAEKEYLDQLSHITNQDKTTPEEAVFAPATIAGITSPVFKRLLFPHSIKTKKQKEDDKADVKKI